MKTTEELTATIATVAEKLTSAARTIAHASKGLPGGEAGIKTLDEETERLLARYTGFLAQNCDDLAALKAADHLLYRMTSYGVHTHEIVEGFIGDMQPKPAEPDMQVGVMRLNADGKQTVN